MIATQFPVPSNQRPQASYNTDGKEKQRKQREEKKKGNCQEIAAKN
jgi:hypothetical protein